MAILSPVYNGLAQVESLLMKYYAISQNFKVEYWYFTSKKNQRTEELEKPIEEKYPTPMELLVKLDSNYQKPSIGLIILTYNCGKFLNETIMSIFNQLGKF